MNRIRQWRNKVWRDFIFNQFEKHNLLDRYQIGGHCGCCGKWVPDAITRSDLGSFFSGWTLCMDCGNVQSSNKSGDKDEL